MIVAMNSVDILVLGAGWTSTFLLPLLQRSSITYAATTTNGRDSTIPFNFDPSSSNPEQYARLPNARTILVTFPLKGPHQSTHLTSLYRQIHGNDNRWIQLGSTGIFEAPHWNDENSPYNTENQRAVAEDELLGLGGCVLNLAGLYGGARNPKAWLTRVAKSKEDVNAKKALHLIHGVDVARAIVAVHQHFTPGKRWLLTDLHVYDWWDLMDSWGKGVGEGDGETNTEAGKHLQYQKWVGELMFEGKVRALPRGPEELGRVLDGRGFWGAMNIWPAMGSVIGNV
ncbi:hypothetical protein MMC30_001014 [Trapelia coarctata]|nr:hypothetical protein [Trapelia coarctata]